ncbi:hypothetical protein HRG_001962 [Hirsutella rhossiliensis]|uniref:Uncharacterized protein n=1 Tax=Hirsutella rhossiliensis TaxID=111463 RepID=A0A9P8N2N8_9HYPO|nr:uncharacterized protein HRG_01962 [Hirsutella rhossiliensis]KAH0966553.1 hypothetical protein HRG_01962 [Hirsutella rhossiliensis]
MKSTLALFLTILSSTSSVQGRSFKNNVPTFEVGPDAKIIGNKIEYNDPDCDPTLECHTTKPCSKPGTAPTLAADKKFFACCLAGQRLLGSPETAFDCCADGHDLVGAPDVGFRCCPTGFKYDGKICKPVCANGKQLVDGKCVCPVGQEEGPDGNCRLQVCQSGLRSGKCYIFFTEKGNILGLQNDGKYYAAPDSMVHRWAKLQLCKDQECTADQAISPSDGVYIRDLHGDIPTGANKGQWINNAANGAHLERTTKFAEAGHFTLTKWPCGRYCLGGVGQGVGAACPAETVSLTFYSQDPQMCFPWDLTEVPCDTKAITNNCIWKSGKEQCCEQDEGDSRPALNQPSAGHKPALKRLWAGVKDRGTAYDIESATLQPSTTPVCRKHECQVLGSYSWQVNGPVKYKIPGSAPVWKQPFQVPFRLPKDSIIPTQDEDSAPVSHYPFEPLFEATGIMSPEFLFDKVDIVVSRNSLRKLIEFCDTGHRQTFRLNLLMVHNTLFIERWEKDVNCLTGQAYGLGYDRNFEREFTKFPEGEENSSGNHRCLRYLLGDLNCVVQFEIDARYDKPKPAETDAETSHVELSLDQLSIADRTKAIPQSAVAEIKTIQGARDRSRDLAQLWFGRVPWLITGHHTAGLFTSIVIADVAPKLDKWERDRQVQLRKLATLLTRFRDAVTGFGGNNCVAIYERNLKAPTIRVCESNLGRRALPDDCIQKFWASE